MKQRDENGRFVKGCTALNPILKGQHLSPKTEIKKGERRSIATEFTSDMSGEKSIHWKGGKHIDKRKNTAYIRFTDDSYEHRVLVEKAIGKKLLTSEHVHHIDGNGLNNNPANLKLMQESAHHKLHGEIK